MGLNKDGSLKLYLKKNFQYHNRGTVYSIPQPKGGRRANELILREDQKEHQRALMMKKKLEKKALNEEVNFEFLNLQSGYRTNATGSPVFGYGRKNVNEVRGRRRK